MNLKNTLGLVSALCLLQSCEKVDVDVSPTGNDTNSSATRPTAVGKGTQESPYTPDQVIAGEMDGKLHWFIGYVVGSTYSTMKNALFDATTQYESNILIASSAECRDAAKCVPVELKTESLKENLSLSRHPEGFQECIMVQGRCLQYFRTNGIREIKAGYWLPRFYIPRPEEWENENITY